MTDATISHARMRDLACLGRARSRPTRWRRPLVAVRFTPSAARPCCEQRRRSAGAPQSGQLTPRAHDLVASII
jgi:hypothetical protein